MVKLRSSTGEEVHLPAEAIKHSNFMQNMFDDLADSGEEPSITLDQWDTATLAKVAAWCIWHTVDIQGKTRQEVADWDANFTMLPKEPLFELTRVRRVEGCAGVTRSGAEG